ncbi:myotubularin-related protein 13-like [Oppia nitens]|uniref:myotubularin-related protein 13-like n=1 Tax=Oppia nitens TaxID=1686743 RepID=UPI0023DB0A0B|nr:myotubularin-related protein 13-like [Oppia nitens]
MCRLADYFVVVGFGDHTKSPTNGKLLQRFPQKDWDDCPFIDSIEMFCQPLRWRLTSQPQQPSFFMFVLTDIDANRHYCACLSFNETVSIQPTKHDDEDIDDESITSMDSSANALCNGSQHHSVMFATKCLVLVSRFNYRDILKNCLTTIYTAFIENMDISLEVVVANILACVDIPPQGGPQIRFSIGANDRQCLQPPQTSTIPVTHTTVHNLFEQLGIHSVVNLVCAAMTEHKILFHSRSYTRLTDACHALTSLMYPFVYNHVYIPILPHPLLEVLSTPTPFLMGIHSSLKNEVTDLLDVIVVDLDGGSITIPDCLRVPHFDEPLHSQLITHLCQVIRPQLIQADDAFPSSHVKPSLPQFLDKEIRAIFVRTFAQILQGYRSCLTIIRIHPKPVITFHKASFLGQRNLVDNEFVVRLLDCMFFVTFVQERGLPYRQCDLFDELYSSLQNMFKDEMRNSEIVVQHIRELAQQIYINENPTPPQPNNTKIPLPTDGAFTRTHLPTFPILNIDKIQEIIDNEKIKKEMTIVRRQSIKNLNNVRIVPMGTPISSVNDIFGANHIITNSARRLEVMRNCINCIFENKISDAKKTFPAVLRALKTKNARLALCQELSLHKAGNKAVLEHQQFDLIVRLMNCVLQDDSHLDVNGVAANMLPLAIAFCRRLCTNVIQFACTCIQDHAVWSNPQFWEQTFYLDVEIAIKNLYKESSHQKLSPENSFDSSSSFDSKRDKSSSLYELSALEIAAEQMRLAPQMSPQQIDNLIQNESSTIFAQAIHYANIMVSMRVPLEAGAHNKAFKYNDNDTNSVSNLTNNVFEGSASNGSNNNDNESGFEEDNRENVNQSEIGSSVLKFVTRFVDKVCTESGVSEEYIKQLHEMIPGVVTMQMETLESVWRESKRLPPITKPKITTPNLLFGEELTLPGLRSYLIHDGRDEGQCGVPFGTQLIPTEGAIFLTNYRIIFKGRPCDPFASESVIVRSLPIATLTKEKRINVQSIASIDQFLQEGLQLRSNTFQLIRVAFDEEVSSDEIENFRKCINRERTPPTIFHLFTFTSQLGKAQTKLLHLQKHNKKNSTIKGIAKKTLLRTAQKAGFKTKNDRKNKYITDSSGYFPGIAKTMSPTRKMSVDMADDKSVDSESIASINTTNTISPSSTHMMLNHMNTNNDANKTMEQLQEMSYVKDYQRLSLGSLTAYHSSGPSSTKLSRSNTVVESFRISTVNINYSVTKSYPGLLVVPYTTSDEAIRRLSRFYRHYRFPVITWKHPRTRGLLLRGSCFHGKGVIGLLKSQTTTGAAHSMSSETSTNIENEKFISNIVRLTPSYFLRHTNKIFDNGSNLSVNLMRDVSATPETVRKSISGTSAAFHRAMNTLRNSGGKSAIGSQMGKQLQKWSNTSIKDKNRMSSGSDLQVSAPLDSQTNLNRAVLYIFGEKNQINKIKTESFNNCDFIPVDIHEVRAVKNSFKKLMRACLPSTSPTNNADPEQSFYRQFENSEWLSQLRTIMQISGAIVDLIDIQGSSVMVCLEDGWDFVPQIVSIAQLCLDPYYRTFDGFRTLIEKEWLAFGHRFSHRSNHTAATLSSGFAPIFLQFLDIVHQIHDQFPISFEFNQHYLKFLAYHYVSCRFRTFLLDCESERTDVGWISEDVKFNQHTKHDESSDEEDDSQLRTGTNKSNSSNSNQNFNYIGTSFWEYSSKIWSKSPLFFNFYYVPIISQEGMSSDAAVIRPLFNTSSLKIWDYYLNEELAHGPSYDIELVGMEHHRQEVLEATTSESDKSQRKIITACYDSIIHSEPNCFQNLLHIIKGLEEELNYMQQKWFTVWDKIEIPLISDIHESISSRSLQYSTHKRSTIDLLIRGKMCANSDNSNQLYLNRTHKLQKYNYTTLTQCDHCRHVLWGIVNTGLKCIECGFNCHEKCAEFVTKNCQPKRKLSAQPDSGSGSIVTQRNGLVREPVLNEAIDEHKHDTNIDNGGTLTHSNTFFNNFMTVVPENRTFEGYLNKKGALLKGWKERWFVLDSTQHQLRYYDSREDPHCKGFIDLAEVQAVIQTTPNSPVFDLKLSRRTYNFMAPSIQIALEWIEKLQACLQ